MIRLSFVIPVYNGERYLPQLIESLFHQDIPEDEYEMLFVDDGSTDSSVALINSFVGKHKGVRIVCHSRNSRLATTCNTGLDNARGKYLWFVDQDDRIEQNCLGKMLQQVENQDLDLFLFNYKRIDQCGNLIDAPKVFGDVPVTRGKIFVDAYFPNSICYYLLGYRWRVLFSRDYMIRHGIRFIDGMMYDDTTILIKSILNSDRLASVSDAYYYYRINENSITYARGKKGWQIYEFAFLVGKEVSAFGEECRAISLQCSEMLLKKAEDYYNGFVMELFRASIREKKVFYDLVRRNATIVNQAKPSLKVMGRVLLMPIFGPLLSVFLSGLYKMRHFRKNM